MNKIETSILAGVLADVERLAAAPPDYFNPDHYAAARQREAVALAQRSIVAVDAARWLGREITPSGSVAVSRAYKRLERDGLIVRRALGFGEGKTTHLELTREGEAEAKRLVEGGVDG